MARPLSGPIVVIDDEDDIVMLDNETEDDDLAILEHGFPTTPKKPSKNSCDLKSQDYRQSIPSETSKRQDRNLVAEKQIRTSATYLNGRSLSSRILRPLWSGSDATDIPINHIREQAAVSGTERRMSNLRTLSLEPSPRSSPPLSSISGPCSSLVGTRNLPIEVTADACDLTNLDIGCPGQGPAGEDVWEARWRAHLFQEDVSSEIQREGQPAIEEGVLIDLEDLENEDDLWVDEDELQIIYVSKRKAETSCHKSLKVIEQRNPPIIEPLARISSYIHNGISLLPAKAVELADGDFLRIEDIIQNTKTGLVTLRGRRFQRCNTMNGLLEKKLNEVCLFSEIDLDDPRKPQEQSAIETPVDNVKGLRNIRHTNLNFPLSRNISVAAFQSKNEAAAEGGLTARWRYTCIYNSATDRWQNNPRERALQRFEEDECTPGCGVAASERRFQWRGETIPGGSYQPTLMVETPPSSLPGYGCRERPASIGSDNPTPDMDHFVGDPSLSPPHTPKLHDPEPKRLTAVAPSTPPGKRVRSSQNEALVGEVSRPSSKKARCENGDKLEDTRQQFSKLRVDEQTKICGQPVVDLTRDLSTSEMEPSVSITMGVVSAKSLQHSAITKIPPLMDLCSSIISIPPPTGTVQSKPQTFQSHVIRTPGQMLTYGDAFCGAGGSTRGATMAGLRVLWGFDFWEHACATWRSNFPQATCFELPSHLFVSMAQGSDTSAPVDVKVDVLHLSPPCQYFSPAHTVNSASDEMNIASLFAVGPVILVAKPRIVTLEQTFGIAAVRFRQYFNSLIHMFTSLHFSVRWAIVPLAQWGLPQRRYRLIVIAACPGEILPKMPAPTHAEDPSSGLKPFNTVNATISLIPPSALDHDPLSLSFPPRHLKPWDGNSILPRAMTTSGGQNYHPSGERDFTLREYAALQGFPENHVFRGSYVKKQIGNAVPPCVAKVLFESIRRELEGVDGVAERERDVVVVD